MHMQSKLMPDPVTHPLRCPRCRINHELCYCSEIPSLAISTRVVLLTHIGEANKMSSTAMLGHEIFGHQCEVRWVGALNTSLALDDLAATDGTCLYLFPWNNAPVLTPEFAAALPRPITLVVPDGTWRQARKIKRRNLALHQMPSVRLPETGVTPHYLLRRQTHPAHVCTLEAVARAVSIIEGQDFQTPVEQVLAVMTDRGFRLRQRRPGDRERATT